MKMIYIADDDKKICELLKAHIEDAGYIVKTFKDGEDLYHAFIDLPSDMIITDIMMPKMTGYDLCREVRKISIVPIFMISAHNDEIDRVLGLELGSDDYISKPISFRELLIKIKNTFNRLDNYTVKKPDQNVISLMDVTLNKENREVYIKDKQLLTSSKEFDLLKLLMENLNRAFSREELIEHIWSYDYFGDKRQVDHVIKRLRKKMLQMDAELQIQTVWGFGYKIGDNYEEKHS